MRIRYLISVIAIASVGFAGTIEPAAAGALRVAQVAADVPLLSSCESPPDTPDATVENRDRFIDLWLPRFRDKAWMTNYVEAERVPAEIRAEGFHDTNKATQVWLTACLVDAMLDVADESPSAKQHNLYLTGANLLVFGKQEIAEMRDSLAAKDAPVDQLPVNQDMTSDALQAKSDEVISEPSLTSEDLPRSDARAPSPTVTKNVEGAVAPQLTKRMDAQAMVPETSEVQALQGPIPNATALALPGNLLNVFPIPQLLAAIDALLQLISKIQGVLFTLPGLNILASAFYKICAESPTMPLKCSISLPVGLPIPADVTGDNLPDVTGWLSPLVGGGAVGAKFMVTRLFPGQGKLPAHVYAVYDSPVGKKRIQFGYDGRADTLANRTATTFKLHNILAAITGDVNVSAQVLSYTPGSAQSLTFAIKSLVGGSAGVPASEEDPVAGAVQMSPVPDELTMNARLIHTAARDQDIFTVGSSTPTKVDAVIDQATTTTTPQSNRRFTAEVDKLPTSVTVDLVRTGDKQTIDYTGSAPIDLVKASDKATPDVTEPDSYTESIYEVHGVPTNVHVDMLKTEDITYSANAKIPEVAFQTRTLEDGVLQRHVSAKAHQIPKSVHVTNLTTEDQTAFTYDADTEMQDVELSLYDLNEDDETNLQAKATGIPTQMAFTQTKSTGVYDFSANTGIDLIEAQLSRNGGLLLPLPGKDHATVLKSGEALGLDFRLSGFRSAHFDGSEDTTVALGLDPGGQTFDAIADLDDPNVLATAHVGALPTDMEVTLDPADGAATYSASSIIPLLQASFTDRDTEMFATAELTDLPKNIGLTFNTSGATPEVTYDADSRLGSIDVTYSEKPGGLAIHGLISDLPEYMKIGGIDPIVFDARTSAGAAPGSSHLGQVAFEYATDGTFASPPTGDDHVYLDTVSGTHAGLQYSGLRLLSVDTSDEELHAEVRNTDPRLFRAYLTTPTLTLDGFIDKVPAEIRIDQVGNTISYDASSVINEIYTNLARDNGDTATVSIKGITQKVSVLFDGAASKLAWNADADTGSISAAVHLTPDTIGGSRNFDAGLTITSIPKQWDASWANGNVLFQAPDGIGSIEATVTNHGSTHTLADDHLNAYYREGGDLDASLKISNLRKASFTKLNGADGGGFEAALKMGNHGLFNFGADVVVNAGVLKASGQFSNLPSDLTLRSDGGRITYNGDSNPNLTVSVEAGTSQAAINDALPVPNVHGVAVRDGASGADRAVAANLYLTGLPNGLDLNSKAGTYKVIGYHPTDPTLVVDVALTDITPEDLTLYLTQGVPNVPVDFTFGPFLSDTLGDGTHTLSLNYTATKPLGALNANATYGAPGVGDEAQLTISEIPKTITVTGEFGASTKHINVTMDDKITSIVAAYKTKGAVDFAASVTLTDVPKTVDILIGRATDSDGGTDVTAPDFTMTAFEPGLDIFAVATAELVSPANIRAAATLDVDNMGHTVTGALNGKRINIASTPATQEFLLKASGHVNVDVNLGFTVLGGLLTNEGNLNIDIDIKQVTLGFKNASTLQLDLGVTTGLKGDYSEFTFGEDTRTIATLRDRLRFVVTMPDPFPNLDFTILNIPETSIDFQNVISEFRLATNTYDVFWSDGIDIGVAAVEAQLLVRPHAHSSTNGPSFTVPQPPSDGVNPPAWLITPNPNLLGFSVPDYIVDVVAYFTSPYGHDLGFRLRCWLPIEGWFDCTP